jgi:hypothetical protein
MTDKKATANDLVLRAMEFKKGGCNGADDRENLTPGELPEIDFVRKKAGEVGKTLIVGDAYIKFHGELETHDTCDFILFTMLSA